MAFGRHLGKFLAFSLFNVTKRPYKILVIYVYFGNPTGTSKRELDALEADFGPMVLRSAARTIRDERKEDAQVRKKNGEAISMKVHNCCAIRKFY